MLSKIVFYIVMRYTTSFFLISIFIVGITTTQFVSAASIGMPHQTGFGTLRDTNPSSNSRVRTFQADYGTAAWVCGYDNLYPDLLNTTEIYQDPPGVIGGVSAVYGNGGGSVPFQLVSASSDQLEIRFADSVPVDQGIVVSGQIATRVYCSTPGDDFYADVTLNLSGITVIQGSSASITANLSVDKSIVMRGSNIVLSWSSDARFCSGEGFNTGGSPNGFVEMKIYNPTTFVLNCTKVGADISDTVSVDTFRHKLRWVGKLVNDCASASGAPALNSSLQSKIRFFAEINTAGDVTIATNGGSGYVPMNTSTCLVPYENGYCGVWGGLIPKTYTVSGDPFSNDPTFLSQYSFCSATAAQFFSYTTQQEREVSLYYRPQYYLTLNAKVGNSCGDGSAQSLTQQQANALELSFHLINPVGYEFPAGQLGVGTHRVAGNRLGTYSTLDPQAYINNSSYEVLCVTPDSVTIDHDTLDPGGEMIMTAYIRQTGPPAVLDAPDLSGSWLCYANRPPEGVVTQIRLGWTNVSGAEGYRVYDAATSTLLGQTSVPSFYIANIVGGASSRSFYVEAYGGGQTARSNTITLTRPSCTTPPQGTNPTLIIDPPSSQVCMGQNTSFMALYDPDGSGTDYGEFDVSSVATWSSSNTSVASSQGGGVFRGVAAGSVSAFAGYRSLSASALLGVNNCSAPDFSVSISPSIRYANITDSPASVYYTVSVGSLQGFSGPVNLSVRSVVSPLITTTFFPVTVAVPMDGSASSQLRFDVPQNAPLGRDTFYVDGASGGITKSASADLDIFVDTIPDPTITATINAVPDAIDVGGSSTLYWDSSGAIQCSINQGVGTVCSNSVACDAGGNRSVSPVVDTTYTLTCTNTSQQATDTTQVTILPVDAPLSCVIRTTNPAWGGQVVQGGSVTDTYTIIASGGTLSNREYLFDPGDGDPVVGWQVNNRFPHSYSDPGTYTIVGSVRDSAETAQCQRVVVVNGDGGDDGSGLSCTMSVVPSQGDAPLSVNATINASEADEYSFNAGDGTGQTAWSNRSSFDHVYRDGGAFTATGFVRTSEGDAGSCLAFVSVRGGDNACRITAKPSAVLTGQSSELSWECNDPSVIGSCEIDQGIGSVSPYGGSVPVTPDETTLYTLSCDGVADDTATVSVGFLPVIREIIPR